MEILYLSGAVLPSEVSHSISIMRVCQAFADAGHDVTLTGVAPGPDAPDPIAFYGLAGGFQVVRHVLPGLADTRWARSAALSGLVSAMRTRALLDQFQPDLVYSRLTVGELAFVPPRVPIVYEMHSLWPIKGNMIQRTAFRWLVARKRFRRIIVTTDSLAELLETTLDGTEVTIARLSAEPPVAIGSEELSAFRQGTLDGRGFRFHIGYTGYMDTYGLRGTEIIVQTAARMPHAAFHLVGGEPRVVDHWRAYAKNFNTHGNIFFYGYRPPDQMPLFLNCFDVVLAPLQWRPASRAPTGQNMSPLKLPQYMAYARPIVASDLPAHLECLVPDKTALLVPPADVDGWVKAIDRLLKDPELRRVLGAAAYAAYEADYTPRIRVRRILDGL